MPRLSLIIALSLTASSVFGQSRDVNTADLGGTGAHALAADIWVDNWFTLWANGEPLHEDSTPYMTERSFNAEQITFNADLPLTLAFEFRDFMENDTGLEYIGTGRQQQGDGGAIAQFRDAATGAYLATSNADWRCIVTHSAPVDASCATLDDPQEGVGVCASTTTDVAADWTQPDFDDSAWAAATEHSAADVSPKMGYDEITWSPDAQLIWGPDLKDDNIVMCRVTITD